MKVGDLIEHIHLDNTVGIIIKVYPLTQEVTVTWIDGGFPARCACRCGIETLELISASR